MWFLPSVLPSKLLVFRIIMAHITLALVTLSIGEHIFLELKILAMYSLSFYVLPQEVHLPAVGDSG